MQFRQRAGLSLREAKRLQQVAEAHPMRVNPYYLSLIDWGDPLDPIRKMALPSLDELNRSTTTKVMSFILTD
jgi:L-lysine 2,3-aminomutase